MVGLTLDAGPLIAWERGDVTMGGLVARSLATRRALTVPAAVLAEVWRGGPRSARLSRLLAVCWIDPLGEEIAKLAGVLLGRAGSDQTLDALVVASALTRGDRVLTGDADDVRPLADAAGIQLRVF